MNGTPLDHRLMVRTASAMYAGAAFAGLVGAILPGGPSFSPVPGAAALAIAIALVLSGSRVPLPVLSALGPLGVALIAHGLATSPGPGDGAGLYIWPALWTAFFFGTAGTAGILGSVAFAHAAVLIALPSSSIYLGRWLDVMTAVTVVAVVVRMLVDRNEQLVARHAAEARTDPLSGLLNRRGFLERAAIEVSRARRDGTAIAVASFDIDGFKSINDDEGHDVGDLVITHFASVLRSQARQTDLIARLGGDEFVALLVGPASSDAPAYTARVSAALANEKLIGLPRYTVSAGVATEAAPTGVQPLLVRSDSALYAAKNASRRRSVGHTPTGVAGFSVAEDQNDEPGCTAGRTRTSAPRCC